MRDSEQKNRGECPGSAGIGPTHPAPRRGRRIREGLGHTETPAELIDVEVSEGWVTLSGVVSYQFESDAAYDDVAGLVGVVGITNEIRMVNP